MRGTTAPRPLYPDVSGNYLLTKQVNASVSYNAETINQENLVFGTSFTRVPMIWQSELAEEYQELGYALSTMTELDETDEWKIEQPVYEAASNVAVQLMANAYPAPRVFTHGPKSVVFNWSQDNNNLYLTISADKLSALISTPQEIKRRIDYPASAFLNPAFVLTSLESTGSRQPLTVITSSASTPPKFVD